MNFFRLLFFHPPGQSNAHLSSSPPPIADSLNGPFPPTSRRYHHHHHKPKRCLPIQPCRSPSSCPLLFHPSTKGSQIVMDMSQRTVKRQASFCNAITFSNRPIAVYEQVRLKVTKIRGLWPNSCVNTMKTRGCACLEKAQG